MCLYILRGRSTGRFYVGVTEDVELRLAQHNDPATNPSRWTRAHGPWDLAFQAEYANRPSALRAERFVKRMKSAKFLEKLISGQYRLPRFES